MVTMIKSGSGESALFRSLLMISGVDVIDDIGRADLQSVGAISIVQDGQPYTVFFDDERVIEFPIGFIGEGTRMNNGFMIQNVDGSFQPCLPRSRQWLLALIRMSNPASLAASASSSGEEN